MGVLVGAVLSFGRVASEAYLLSTWDPINAIYVATAASVAFTFALPRVNWERIKFARMAGVLTLAFALLLAILTPLEGEAAALQALLWYFVVIFSTAFHRWVASELVRRHVNPALAQSYYAYLNTAQELGTLVVLLGLLGLQSYGTVSPSVAMLVMGVIYIALAALVTVHFGPTRNLEVVYETGQGNVAVTDLETRQNLKYFVGAFIGLMLVLGAFKVSAAYVVTIALKDEYSSNGTSMATMNAAIQEVMTSYYLVASAASIVLSVITGRLVRTRHISPLWLIGTYVVATLGIAIFAGMSDIFIAFIALAVVRRIAATSFLSPGVMMLVSAFAGQIRARLRAAHSLYYYTVASLPLALVYTYTSRAVESQRTLVGGTLVVLLLVAIGALLLTRRRVIPCLYCLIDEGSRAGAVSAVQALSYLKPPHYSDRMEDLLDMDPRLALRKTIILGLGHVNYNRHTTQTIMGEFKSDREEIQIAVLDALKLSRRYEALQFLAKVMMAKEMSHSLRVRMNAAKVIAALYGRKAIPFLLNGLDDPDERVVANTLEVLSVFRDKNLARYFREYVESSTPRVRANALMGLGRYRSEREAYMFIMQDALVGEDPHMLASVMYVIGALRDYGFATEIDRLLTSDYVRDPAVNRVMAWTLTRLGDSRGIDLFCEMLAKPLESHTEPPYMHFLAQIPKEVRFDLLKMIAVEYQNRRHVLETVHWKFGTSHLDFHEEVQYFDILLETLGQERVVKMGDSVPVLERSGT